jgi:MFS family permease
MLQVGLAIFGAASLAAGLTQTQELLFAARAFQGLGSAFIAAAALSILTTTFTRGPERAKALGPSARLTFG